ncbi:MAG: metallophosphoesterase [Polyangiaceae bacterium]|nr:metallophosphoesterase [Polyangiaceae bacterium]
MRTTALTIIPAVVCFSFVAAAHASDKSDHGCDQSGHHARECHRHHHRHAAREWTFGVMSDTQWKANLDGENPETVAVGIINQINAAFIEHDVEFVIQVGDLVDKETDSPNGNSSNRTMDTRAAAAQALYDAGIGFFPVRGNHEGSATAATELPVLFPQTSGTGPNVGKATHFTSPFELLAGLSYSFDYKNARFVLVDQFTRPDGSNYLGSSNNNAVDQIV